VAHTSVTRVLVSDRLDDGELAGLVEHVRSLGHRDLKLRIRVAAAEEIQDRCVVSRDRVLQVGGLPSAVGGGASVISEPHDLGEQTREHYRAVWRSATRLVSHRPRRGRSRAA
ncbi:MAG TPA: hypothetical protein PK912_08130, partial [Microthrixaceae bacterium]|nr:hypothetical protein [Microthrixaceae bacterium]